MPTYADGIRVAARGIRMNASSSASHLLLLLLLLLLLRAATRAAPCLPLRIQPGRQLRMQPTWRRLQPSFFFSSFTSYFSSSSSSP
jgi:hypothetical protein